MEMKLRTLLFFCLLFCFSGQIMAQKRVVTLGVQFRPIQPLKFINSDFQTQEGVDFSYSIAPKFGYSAGVTVRYGLTNRISLETGLGFVQRNYDLTVDTAEFSGKSDFRIIGYELPVSALVFIPLAKNFYMNASAGLQMTLFPSNVTTKDEYFLHFSSRRTSVNGGGIANIGWEYRTEKAGFFYLGASYQVPFTDIYDTFVRLPEQANSDFTHGSLNGSYLSFDIRYFFHEFPVPKRKKVKKKKKRKDRDSEKSETD